MAHAEQSPSPAPATAMSVQYVSGGAAWRYDPYADLAEQGAPSPAAAAAAGPGDAAPHYAEGSLSASGELYMDLDEYFRTPGTVGAAPMYPDTEDDFCPMAAPLYPNGPAAMAAAAAAAQPPLGHALPPPASFPADPAAAMYPGFPSGATPPWAPPTMSPPASDAASVTASLGASSRCSTPPRGRGAPQRSPRTQSEADTGPEFRQGVDGKVHCKERFLWFFGWKNGKKMWRGAQPAPEGAVCNCNRHHWR
eukprot:TRINITY_DN3737_c1_g1_i1.p3 TRINITY_DN3737_c1_g1~~TRINITY_DN3737_c1_g1_i1.p3  ORF type:complete len:283 (+),score=73.76 TRINITY_DN3737_c1_g1_i1:99-851(+)